MSQVWLITGSTSGFGSEIAQAALARGDKVIATARRTDSPVMADLVSKGAVAVSLDINHSDEEVAAAVASAHAAFGRIDILLNNAGFLLQGPIEAISHEEALGQFNTNVFGQLRVARAVLPFMRAKRSGTVAFMGSIAGWAGYASAGMYSASKWALTGISNSLKLEVKHLGIEVTAIEPGYFRTQFLKDGHQFEAKKEIADYDPVVKPMKEMLAAYNGKQPGRKDLPERILLGTDAVKLANERLKHQQKELDEWSAITSKTDLEN
ncbi:3-oxoacyl-reductase [Phlyctochytrium arcticum]|nr:3-oxoacyl-reductase [Phlyctochytrium arcticum]